tara:strand:+ start:87 stop:509 length:423 start_codon:yes stop_codon:yes gene_type:complete
MKVILLIHILFLLLSGCSGPQDGVLSSLLMGGVLLIIVFVSVIVHYIIKGSKFLIGITPDMEKRSEKKKLKEARKKYLKQISDDRKFIKRNWNQYKKYHQKYIKKKYPRGHHWTYFEWVDQIEKAKERIKFFEESAKYKK